MDGGEEGNKRVPVDTVKYRLEQLDDSEEGAKQNVMNMSQQECIKYLEQLNKEITNAWNGEERVRSLKLMIQTAKLLQDPNIPRVFYPSMFILVTEILDNFGDLVYDRIKARAVEEDPKLARVDLSLFGKFKLDLIPNDARETCRNWFFKVAGVRDILPRVYVELAILKSQRFVEEEGISNTLNRIGAAIRGIGDPLATTYARCYLARRGIACSPYYNAHNLISAHDMQLSLFRQIQAPRHQELREADGLSLKDYMHLVQPALQYVLDVVGFSATKDETRKALKTYTEHCNASGIMLQGLLNAYPADHLVANIGGIVQLVKNADLSDCAGAHKLYAGLGAVLVKHAPADDKKLSVLNEVWKDVTKIEDPAEYTEAAEVSQTQACG